MKRMRYNLLTLWCLLLVVSVKGADVYNKDYTKDYHETYKVQPGVKLNIENRYGDINMEIWDRNEIDIKVEVTIKSTSQSKAQRYLDRIDVDMEGSTSSVTARTRINENSGNNNWLGNLLGGGYVSFSDRFEIEYTVKMPREVKLNIENKYADINCGGDVTGNAYIINKHGNIYFQNIDGNLRLDLGYGEGTIGDVQNFILDIKYSSFTSGDANDVTIDSKNCDFRLGNFRNLTCSTKYDDYKIKSVAETFNNDGKYDDFNIGGAGELYVSTKYATFTLGRVDEEIKFSAGNSSLRVKESSTRLSDVDIDGKYTDVYLTLSDAFKLDFEGKYTDLDVPDEFEEAVYDKDGSELEVEGFYKSKSGTDIEADMKYGELKIRIK